MSHPPGRSHLATGGCKRGTVFEAGLRGQSGPVHRRIRRVPMPAATIAIIVVVAVVVLVISAMAMTRRRLQQRFGPEYDRVVGEKRGQFRAAAELARRERRVQRLRIRPLSASG